MARRKTLIATVSILLLVVLALVGAYFVRLRILERQMIAAMGKAMDAGDAATVSALLRSDPRLLREMTRKFPSPLHWAAWVGSPELAALLLDRGVPVDVPLAAEDLDRLEGMRCFPWAPKVTPLYVAVWRGKAGVARLLISRGADPRRAWVEGRALVSPLTGLALESGDADTLGLVLQAMGEPILPDQLVWMLLWLEPTHNAAAVRLLAWYGSIDKVDEDGSTALACAVDNDYDEILPLLISKGADVNFRDGLGNTPLHRAILKFNTAAAELFVAHGSRLDIRNNAGLTPLNLAQQMRYPDMEDLLRKAGAKE